MNNIPTFKLKNGKFIYNRLVVNTLISAINSNQSQTEFDNKTIKFVEHIKTDDNWIVICEVVE